MMDSVLHLGAECCECGEDPILGTRYRSTQRHNYDICELCFQQHHQQQSSSEEFIALHQCVTREELSKLGPPPSAPKSAAANSLEDLTVLLQQSQQPQDSITPTSPSCSEEINLYLNLNRFSNFPDTTLIQLRLALLQNTTVTSLKIFLRGTHHLQEAMLVLAEALMNNTSIWSLSISICASRRQGRADRATAALKALMESHHTNIRVFQFQTVSRFGLHGADSNPRNGEDVVADYLFAALAKTSLCRFCYSGHCLVSNSNKMKACQAMTSNPHLRRIEATFDEDDCQLAILTGIKNRKWMQRWTGEAATKQERVSVLEEIMYSRQLDGYRTAVIYHFLRCHPRLILE